jgi:tripartite-type tricarboxylate transporter receptor subunit TctC
MTARAIALCVTLIAYAALVATQVAVAQSYPSKPVRIIVGGPPAGGADVIVRPIAQKLSESLGQQFIVENRPGAGSIIAGQVAAGAAADGYTMVEASASGFAIAPFLLKKRPYDPVNDFTPVMLIAKAPMLLTVHPSLPVKTVQDLIALAKSKPRQLFYASNGNGSFSHLTTEMFSNAAGVALTHVPYKGGTPAVLDTISGQVQMIITAMPTLLPQVRASRLRPLAVTSAIRSRALPQLPTVREAGVGGFESVQWYGFLAPKNTPMTIVQKLQTEIRKAAESVTLKPLLENEGAELALLDGEAFSTFMKADILKWQKVIREAKLVLQ